MTSVHSLKISIKFGLELITQRIAIELGFIFPWLDSTQAQLLVLKSKICKIKYLLMLITVKAIERRPGSCF